MNPFCARDEHFWRWRRTLLTLETNTSGAGDEHYWRWRRTLLALETNVFCAADKHIENARYVQGAIPNRSYVEPSHSYLQKQALSRCGVFRGTILVF